VILAFLPTVGRAAPVLSAPYNSSYTLTSLGSVAGVPPLYGGLTFKQGDPNTMLLGGFANASGGSIYSIGVVRDAMNHITGFSGTASLFATAPFIDGGLDYGPGGVLFATGFPNNTLMQFKPGSTTPDKTIDLTALGFSSSVGTLAFVPAGQPGAGGLKIAVYNTGDFYDVTLTADGSGTYDILSKTLVTTLPGGPEGLIYVPSGSPLFTGPTMLVSEYSAGLVGAYDVDASGNPILASRRDFMTGLTGAEGAVIDPLTGDFLFSTFGGGDQIFRVTGFSTPVTAVPEPSTLGLAAVAVAGGVLAGRRQRRRSR
jgi:hypothetical protein